MFFIKNIFFIFFSMLYLLIRMTEYFFMHKIPVLSNHITDLCAMPLVLCLCLYLYTKLQNQKNKLPVTFVVILTGYWSMYFEYYLPKQSAIYTGDVLDVIMYVAGSGLFVLWQKKRSEDWDSANEQTERSSVAE
jgi:hypothetical protein